MRPAINKKKKKKKKKKINAKQVVFIVSHNIIIFLTELSSGPKGRRAEPHNYRARIEIEKTMRLSFHGHRG